MKLKTFFKAFGILFSLQFSLFAQENAVKTVEATSSINWITRDFSTNISLDTKAANIQLPSGKKTASSQIQTKMPALIQQPLLILFVDSSKSIGDSVVENQLSLDQVYHFIMGGYKTPDVFTKDMKYMNTTNKINLNTLCGNLVKHKSVYTPQKPIEIVPSRAYSGIIIDARGLSPIHGEYIQSETYPCVFPSIWDEYMNPIYEKNLVNPEVIKKSGEVGYHYSDDVSLYADRVGYDPLYIRATKVFGRNRTDPIIKHSDALKILTVPENVKLMQEGKVVILLDEKNLIYDIAVPEKDTNYYVKLNEAKKYFFSDLTKDITVNDGDIGFQFIANLNFYPDSDVLLPSEQPKIDIIAEKLKQILLDDGYTILVEGHTADVGKPVGQLNLSVDRAIAVMNALIKNGVDEKIFSYKGYGGVFPAASNDTEEGRAVNRRVVITARPRATYIQRE